MDYNEVYNEIITKIVPNQNNEITADVLRPILVDLLQFTNDQIGDLAILNTGDKTNLVNAINEVISMIDNSNSGITIFEGIEDPNTSPPLDFKTGDFYSRKTVSNIRTDLYVYTGVKWFNLKTPTFEEVVNEGGNNNISLLNNDADYQTEIEVKTIVNGLTMTSNQAASEIYLNNIDGERIATINVAFLNNEGTTFVYNPDTRMLELWNDQGQKLSEIPVSDFVSNTIQTANWNPTTPSQLQFFDNEGNVIIAVSYAIANIQGLQAYLTDLQNQLNNKFNTPTGNAAQYVRGDSVLASFDASVRASLIGSDTGTNDPITLTTTNNVAIWSINKQKANILNTVGTDTSNIGFTALYNGDLNTLPLGNYTLAISGTATNIPVGIGTARAFFNFGARSGTDSGLVGQIVIGTSGMAFRNTPTATWSIVANTAALALKSDIATTLTQGTNIPNGADLNTYTNTGLFAQITAANATLPLNYPTTEIGQLEVVRGASNQVYQKYHSMTSNVLHIRRMAGASWSSWRRLINDIELGTKQDLLTSGTNIKTVSGVSILGSGDIYDGGNTLNYIRGDGTSQNLANAVQNATTGTMTAVNSAILTGDSFKTAVNKTQGQINALNTSDGNNVKITGNTVSAPMIVGTVNAQNLVLRRNGADMITFTGSRARLNTAFVSPDDDGGMVFTAGTAAASTRFERNTTGQAAVLSVNQLGSDANALIQTWSKSGTNVAAVRNDGRIYGKKGILPNDFVTMEQISDSEGSNAVRAINFNNSFATSTHVDSDLIGATIKYILYFSASAGVEPKILKPTDFTFNATTGTVTYSIAAFDMLIVNYIKN